MNFIHRANCPLCSSGKRRRLYTDSLTNMSAYLEQRYKGLVTTKEILKAEYEAVICECGFLYQSIIPDEAGLAHFYNNLIPEDNVNKRKYGTRSHYYLYAREAGAISKLIKKPHKDISVLDFGGGWGYWALMCKAWGYDTSHYDLSDKCRSHVRDELKIESLNKLNGMYDFINTDQLFEHLPAPLSDFGSMIGHLNKGGYIHIKVPNARKLMKGFDNPNFFKAPHKALMPLEHLNAFTHKTLINMAKRFDLKYVDYPIIFSHRYGLRVMLKGIARKYYEDFYGTSLYFRKDG